MYGPCCPTILRSLPGALVRCRNLPDAVSFRRMVLAYAVSDLSLQEVAAWASAWQVAPITGPGLFYRLREAEPCWEQVLGQVLSEQVPQAAGGFRLRVVEATVINGPGHVSLSPLLHLDALPSREGPTAKSWMWARLIAAALAQRLGPPWGPLSPWGYALRGTGHSPAREHEQAPPANA
jgi:hypothetical protein